MTDSIHISRNYIEFGTFTFAEILDFQKRGIVRDSDFLRADKAEVWLPASLWITEATTVKAKPAAKKTAAKKKVATKKIA